MGCVESVYLTGTMTASGHFRGQLVYYIDNKWCYENGTIADENAACVRCGKPPTKEGYDACLGYVLGATSACCGHGIEEPYVMKLCKVEWEIKPGEIPQDWSGALLDAQLGKMAQIKDPSIEEGDRK